MFLHALAPLSTRPPCPLPPLQMSLVADAALMDPYHTEWFAWVDAGLIWCARAGSGAWKKVVWWRLALQSGGLTLTTCTSSHHPRSETKGSDMEVSVSTASCIIHMLLEHHRYRNHDPPACAWPRPGGLSALPTDRIIYTGTVRITDILSGVRCRVKDSARCLPDLFVVPPIWAARRRGATVRRMEKRGFTTLRGPRSSRTAASFRGCAAAGSATYRHCSHFTSPMVSNKPPAELLVATGYPQANATLADTYADCARSPGDWRCGDDQYLFTEMMKTRPEMFYRIGAQNGKPQEVPQIAGVCMIAPTSSRMSA